MKNWQKIQRDYILIYNKVKEGVKERREWSKKTGRAIALRIEKDAEMWKKEDNLCQLSSKITKLETFNIFMTLLDLFPFQA